nr:cathepsin L1 [Crassostrea gigas]
MYTMHTCNYLFLACVAPLVLGLNENFQAWKQHFGKQYRNSREENYRYGIWKRNLDLVYRNNKDNTSGFLMEMNKFADEKCGGYRKPSVSKTFPVNLNMLYSDDVPDSFDWRKKGAVSPVKNQGQMGSALAFATVDSIESMHFIKTGQLVDLSTRELVQCCNASMMSPTFDCVQKLGGICSAASYPDSHTCQSKQCTPVAKVTGVTQVKKGDEGDLKIAVYRQPVVTAVDASHSSFQLYRSGVYYEPRCSSTRLDHALLVVGYGTLEGKDFWIAKNSWGINWGMKGYILMSRNKNNNCGIATSAMYPDGM